MIRLRRLGRCNPLAADRPSDRARAGVFGGPGVYGVPYLEDTSVPGIGGVGQIVKGVDREGTKDEVESGRERDKAFGLERFM